MGTGGKDVEQGTGDCDVSGSQPPTGGHFPKSHSPIPCSTSFPPAPMQRQRSHCYSARAPCMGTGGKDVEQGIGECDFGKWHPVGGCEPETSQSPIPCSTSFPQAPCKGHVRNSSVNAAVAWGLGGRT